MIDFAVHIAKGMQFLHEMLVESNGLLSSYDLNSKHVMIDEDLICRLNMADCVFAFDEGRTKQRKRLHDPAWMAPEGRW